MATTASPEESKHPPQPHNTAPKNSNQLTPPAFSQVTWETALWTLIPLAINTMSQPSGCVCSFPAKYRTYLRSSPLFCLADSLSILIHLILYLTTFPFKDGIRLLIQQRFGKEDDEDIDEDANESREEGIQAIEKLTWLRWIFFVFGTLGPGIKLMAMGGVPLTKAFGAIFLISFVMVEVLVILSWLYGNYEAVPEAHDAEKLKKTKDKLSEIDDWLQASARALHGVLLVWAAVDIHNGFHDHFRMPPEPLPPFLGFLGHFLELSIGIYGFIFELMIIFLIPYAGFLVKTIPSLLLSFLFDFDWQSGIGAVLLVGIHVWFIWILINYDPFDFKKEMLIDLAVDWAYLLAIGLPLLLVGILLDLTEKSIPRWARSMFITLPNPEEGRKRRSGMDSNLDVTYWCFMMFFYSTVLCVVWYVYRYNPEGTVNRGWTGVFG
jgi:hypothetical protein